ncbi:pentapeptide repeat-containing protein [Streptomyces sp. NPDC012474]|uniref:pentapeptide repeat-containing protein n=1 Tax=Streptomyces sp. NPDC012474 TaxID=3364836 RepID=UPI0036EAADCC
MTPGADIFHEETVLSSEMITRLLDALRDPESGFPRIGNASFHGAKIEGDATFSNATIDGDARFVNTTINGTARFDGVNIKGDAWFVKAAVNGVVRFDRAQVVGDVRFDFATIRGYARFDAARVGGKLLFRAAEIEEDARLNRVEVKGGAYFDEAKIGWAFFGNAKIEGGVFFRGASVKNDVSFVESKIEGGARFVKAEIGGGVWSLATTVNGGLWAVNANIETGIRFLFATIEGGIWFAGASLNGGVIFDKSSLDGDARFDKAAIDGEVRFDFAEMSGTLRLNHAVFTRAPLLEMLLRRGTADLSGVTFESSIAMKVEARAVCRRVRWASTATLYAGDAELDLSEAVLEFPVSIVGGFMPDRTGDEHEAVPNVPPVARVASLQGVDAAHLVLTDVDLRECRFAGTIHLDQLRLEGRCPLPATPAGMRRQGLLPLRWTPRRTLVEEHYWRATRSKQEIGWNPAPEGVRVLEPAALAPVYRQLRKAFEDSKNEPGAADFYYGEMEMRRHDPEISLGERTLLTSYWAVSGYGLRATRAVGWLATSMLITMLAMMFWGIPKESAKLESSGRLSGNQITITTETPDPENPSGSYLARLSVERFEKSLRVVINSVVFRSSEQDLTTSGKYVEMVSRVVEPVFLGLAVLAVRGRIKR